MSKIIIENAHVVTNDRSRSEYAGGHVVVEDNMIIAVGDGSAPDDHQGRRRRRPRMPGHAGLRQHPPPPLPVGDPRLRRGRHALRVADRRSTRSGASWTPTSPAPPPPVRWPGWRRPDARRRTDHHYVFPHDGGDLLGAEIDAARRVGLRFHPTRGSMDLGQSQGGLPPDNVVEDIDTILSASEAAIDTHHDPSFDSMLRIALAPCSPFSVTGELLQASADLARRKGVRLHTHLCETIDEEDYCREHFNATPVEYMESRRLARAGRLVRPRRAPGRRVDRQDGRHRHQRGPLPVLQRPARLRHRPGARHARCRHRRGAGRGRRRIQRVVRPVGGASARAAVRPGEGRAASADRARRRGHGHDGRGPGAGPAGRDRLARGRQAGRCCGLAAGHPAAHRHRRPGGRPGARWPTAAGAAAGERAIRSSSKINWSASTPTRWPRKSIRPANACCRGFDELRRP